MRDEKVMRDIQGDNRDIWKVKAKITILNDIHDKMWI